MGSASRIGTHRGWKTGRVSAQRNESEQTRTVIYSDRTNSGSGRNIDAKQHDARGRNVLSEREPQQPCHTAMTAYISPRAQLSVHSRITRRSADEFGREGSVADEYR